MVDSISYSTSQTSQPSESNRGLLKAAGGGGAIFASGFLPWRSKDSRILWDKYLSGLKGIETGSPGAVLRTFRLSELMSPLGTWEDISLSKEQLKVSGKYRDFLSSTLGSIEDGFSLEKGKGSFGSIFDASGKKTAIGLTIESGTQKGAAIADYYARIMGIELSAHESLNDAILRSKWIASGKQVPYSQWLELLEPELRQQRIVLGAKLRNKITLGNKTISLSSEMAERVAKTEVLSNLARAQAASTAGRLNNLLTKPFEIPVIGSALSKIPVIKNLSVKPGSNFELLKRYTSKALLAGAAWKGIEYADYLRANKSPLAAASFSGVAGTLIGGLIAKPPGALYSKKGALIGGAIGLTVGIAPRFEKGLLHGTGSLLADADITRAKASEITGVKGSLEKQDRITPGLVSFSSLLGFAGTGALIAGVSSYGTFLKEGISDKIATPSKKISSIFSNLREDRAASFTKSLTKYSSKVPFVGKYISKIKNPIALGAVAGATAWTALSSGLSLLSGNFMAAIPGLNLLATKEDPEKLKRIYSGEEEVPIREGRFWEFGRQTAYEGGKIEYYRQHAIARLGNRSFQRGIYGSEEERWAHDPLLNPIKALFGSTDWKYHHDIKNAYSRPAPYSSTYGEDIPFIGPAVAATFGKLFKPRKLIRPDEWINEDGGLVHRPDIRGETEPAYHLGGLKPGMPVSPEDGQQLLNELNYKRREAIGLVGFAEGAFQKRFTGREEIFQNMTTFGTMGDERSSRYKFWSHLNIGGAFGSSELIRRFIPNERSYLDEYNPLQNNLPSWIPDDYFLDLKYGDPFKKIKEAEIRLPGPGYSSRYRELEGVNPENYPLAHKVKILGDIAMWSEEYRLTIERAKSNIHELPKEHQKIIWETERQVEARKRNKDFQEYKFRSSNVERREVTVTDVLSPTVIKTKELGDINLQIEGIDRVKDQLGSMDFLSDLRGKTINIAMPSMEANKYHIGTTGPEAKALVTIGGQELSQLMEKQGLVDSVAVNNELYQYQFNPLQRIAGQVSETALHGLDSPIESLTPVSPVSKLIRQRSAIEDYITSEAIGTDKSFWDKPIDNFIAPSVNRSLHKMGIIDIPKSVREKRDINEYFDMLSYMKYSQLEKTARELGNTKDSDFYSNRKRKTVHGADAYGAIASVESALPRTERNFFRSFVSADTAEDQERIDALVPENQRRLYEARWLSNAAEASRAKIQARQGSSRDKKIIEMVNSKRVSSGFEYHQSDINQWENETNGEVPFDDWIRDKKAEEYFSQRSLPGADWLGWSPAVSLDDVKLQYLQETGKDHHDFDLWGERKRALARKPYINSDLIREMLAGGPPPNSTKRMRKGSEYLAKMYGDHKAEFKASATEGYNKKDKYSLQIADGRRSLIEGAYKELGV